MRLKTPSSTKSYYPMPGALDNRAHNQSLQSFWAANDMTVPTAPVRGPTAAPQTMDVDSTSRSLFENFRWFNICIPGFLRPLPGNQRRAPPQVTPPAASTSQVPPSRTPRRNGAFGHYEVEDRDAALIQLQELFPGHDLSSHEAEEQVLILMLRAARRRAEDVAARFEAIHVKGRRLRQAVPETYLRGGFKYIRVNRYLEDRRRALKVEERALRLELMSRKNDVRRRRAVLLAFGGSDPTREGTVDSEGSTPGPTDNPQLTDKQNLWNPSPPQPRDQWISYEARWKSLLSSSDDTIHFRDIAFPMAMQPTSPPEITRDQVVAFLFIPRVEGENVRRQQRLRDALLRWRPDRFGNEILPRVHPKDAASVWEAVGIVSSILFDLLEQEE